MTREVDIYRPFVYLFRPFLFVTLTMRD